MRYAFNIPEFLEWVVRSWSPVRAQAEQASYSRSHYSRSFARSVGEPPRTLRRRLQLEAAAHLLSQSDFQVGEVAIEVGYETPEAFSKAFRRAYGVNPKQFRSRRSGGRWLASKTGIHFHPSGLIVRRQGETSMKLDQILFRHHMHEVTRILSELGWLPESCLDEALVAFGDEIPWDSHDRTLRGTMAAIVFTHDIWLATFRGETMPDHPKKPSIAELRERHEASGPGLLAFVAEVDRDGLWDSEFVDANCEEPVRFVFGAVLAHILTFGIHRRLLLLSALRKLGVKDLEYGDPINWHRTQNGEPAYVPECV